MAEAALPFELARFESIVREAGALALRDYRHGSAASTKSWAKEGGSPVSDADIAVDAFLRDRLGTLLPGAGWLSEETADSQDRLDKRYVWIVDPIDGTRAYLKGKGGWCVSVALVEQGRPIAAALHAPKLDVYYQALLGNGAYANDTLLRVSGRTALDGSRKPAHQLAKSDHNLVAVHCPNSIALRIAMVASGDADLINTSRWGSEWDIAAAYLIATEAGAIVTDVAGHPISFNRPKPRVLGVMATTPGIHDALRAQLAPQLPKIMSQDDSAG